MKRLDINLEYYKIFYYVGKLGGISLAAEELSISQPAVSQAVKQLERCLGSTLFIRTSKGVRLTREGEILFSYIKNGYEMIKFGENRLKNIQNLEMGEIRIGASDMTLQFYLLPFLERFHERYPGIKIQVTNAPTPSTIKYLQEGKIDFG
ncbi:MAG: LysR family transcriptional regulator, partial [Acetivibrio ethanolgignens]